MFNLSFNVQNMSKSIVFQWLWGYSYFEGLATGSLIVDNAIVDSGT